MNKGGHVRKFQKSGVTKVEILLLSQNLRGLQDLMACTDIPSKILPRN